MIGDDWFDLLTDFRQAGVRFLVVGAHAMAVHGFPRATQELDIWIDPTVENATHAVEALARFGAPIGALGITIEDLSTPGLEVQLGLPPNRVDLLTAISGVDDFDAGSARPSGSSGGSSSGTAGRASSGSDKKTSTGRKAKEKKPGG